MKWAVISDPFLGNGSVNTFPWQWLHMQRGKQGVLYAVCTKQLKRRELEQPVQLILGRRLKDELYKGG
jgi:hypothetical protein